MKAISSAKIREGGMIEVDNQILLKLYAFIRKNYIYIYIRFVGTDIWQKICSMKPS